MNLKQAFTFVAALTCLSPNIFVASAAAQSGVVLVDSEQHSRHQSTPHASTSLDGVSIANDNRILYDADHAYTTTDELKTMPEEESQAIPALDEPRCKNSPLKLLIETSGGSIFPLECKYTMLKSKKTQCSETGVLASHCPKACGMCPLYTCSDSKGTFLMGNGSERNCSWLASLNPEQKRSRCKKSSFAKTCRATCKFCPSDDTESNQPSTELSTVPSAVPSFAPSLVSTNAPSVQLSDTPTRELSALPSGELSHQPSSSPTTMSPSLKPSLKPTSSLKPSSKPSYLYPNCDLYNDDYDYDFD